MWECKDRVVKINIKSSPNNTEVTNVIIITEKDGKERIKLTTVSPRNRLKVRKRWELAFFSIYITELLKMGKLNQLKNSKEKKKKNSKEI